MYRSKKRIYKITHRQGTFRVLGLSRILLEHDILSFATSVIFNYDNILIDVNNAIIKVNITFPFKSNGFTNSHTGKQ